jgi:hypothetical protein
MRFAPVLQTVIINHPPSPLSPEQGFLNSREAGGPEDGANIYLKRLTRGDTDRHRVRCLGPIAADPAFGGSRSTGLSRS